MIGVVMTDQFHSTPMVENVVLLLSFSIEAVFRFSLFSRHFFARYLVGPAFAPKLMRLLQFLLPPHFSRFVDPRHDNGDHVDTFCIHSSFYQCTQVILLRHRISSVIIMNSNDSTTRSGPFSHSRQRRAGSVITVATTPASSAKNAPPPPTETRDLGIAAFAETIQERIRTLANENDLLQQAQEHLNDQRALLDEHRQQNSDIRRTYLEASRERLGVELELLQVQDQQRQCQQSTAVLLAETAVSQQETADQQEHWDATMQSIFCQHQCNLELYTKNVQGQIRVRELSAARRSKRLQLLREGAQNFVVEQDWLLEQEKQAQVEMERCNEHESEENDAVQELALQVRASTDKVCVGM
jgi:hypothetical protein